MTEPEFNIRQLCATPVAVIVAHPDDETIGAGAHLASMAQMSESAGGLTIIHVTDGAPRNMSDALAAGFTTRGAYARARRQELLAALSLAGIGAGQTREIGLVDQEAMFNLVPLSLKIAELIIELRPSIALTHPYEGGHPDHDATAFAVHAACELLTERAVAPPAIVEMAFYHNREVAMATGEFLPEDVRLTVGQDGVLSHDCKGLEVVLTEEQRDLKRRMMDCFISQQRVLHLFPPGVEKFRRAPRYDFTRPPHAGDLLYERFDWRISGDEWRAQARDAAYFISHMKYEILDMKYGPDAAVMEIG
jgi:LmbE family N-acetylglucosaminyl deacetylase